MSLELELLDNILGKVMLINNEASRLRESKLHFFTHGSFSSYFNTIFKCPKINDIKCNELISIISSVYKKQTNNYLNFDSEIDSLHRLWYGIIVSIYETPEEVYDKIEERLLHFSSDFLVNSLRHTSRDVENWYTPGGKGAEQCIKNLKDNSKLLMDDKLSDY